MPRANEAGGAPGRIGRQVGGPLQRPGGGGVSAACFGAAGHLVELGDDRVVGGHDRGGEVPGALVGA